MQALLEGKFDLLIKNVKKSGGHPWLHKQDCISNQWLRLTS